ncbi:MAG: 2,3-bisphosphoglycerate-independent phosphoglycerate mutase, partial [Pyrinomonadaceae bacterium]|nr:2,3-bisphosphoglycerate-independent phosphoglycerate mutase [Phycisphaerales bacterium]
MPTATKNTPLVLIIRDGWGTNPHPEHDAFNAAKIAGDRGLTPTALRLDREWPRTLIKTSGEDVGIPDGTMGNSEVGHQNIGAGRIVDQESVAITKACRAGLHLNPAIAGAISRAKATCKNVHLMGIDSDAGVHGVLFHLYSCLEACRTLGQPADKVFIHLFTDGRDTGPFTGKEFTRQVEEAVRKIGVGQIASIMGRYYAMDRDNRWERVGLAYAALTGKGADENSATLAHPVRLAASAEEAIQAYYDAPTNDSQQGDEFIVPTIVGTTPQAQCESRISDGDTVIFYNYRGDRPREISAAFVFPDDKWARVKPSPDSGKHGFGRGAKLNVEYVIMTEYWEELLPYVKVAFPRPPKMNNIAGEYVSSLSLRQFRCAETEKYPHVTFFFNDYREPPFAGEDRTICPSKKTLPNGSPLTTYDQLPEMSAYEICDEVVNRINSTNYDLLVVNFANGDMVGHTGVLPAAVKAVEHVDICVGRLMEALDRQNGVAIITADHG